MKTVFNLLAVAIVLAFTSNPCFAVWDVAIVTPELAKQLGMEFRSTAAGSKHVQVELEFKTDGDLKDFSEVELSFGQGDNLTLRTATDAVTLGPSYAAAGPLAPRNMLAKVRCCLTVP